MHFIKEHGGRRAPFVFMIAKVEPKPLYRAVCESVEIGFLQRGPDNINQCHEWGAPQVHILSVEGGDDN